MNPNICIISEVSVYPVFHSTLMNTNGNVLFALTMTVSLAAEYSSHLSYWRRDILTLAYIWVSTLFLLHVSSIVTFSSIAPNSLWENTSDKHEHVFQRQFLMMNSSITVLNHLAQLALTMFLKFPSHIIKFTSIDSESLLIPWKTNLLSPRWKNKWSGMCYGHIGIKQSLVARYLKAPLHYVVSGLEVTVSFLNPNAT